MNTPGLPALTYRVGTHATFLETMKARLSSADFPELADLKTRGGDDPAIALLDAWAFVADVLTFYQERIANEGYLRTATERRSILEIARLIGYELRPGVAATAYLAYTLDEDRSKTPPVPSLGPIPASSRAQSVPDPGELPQSFETSDALDASSKWNNLQVRLTRPQKMTCDDDPETGVTNLETIYFEGLATNLTPNDPLLIVCGFGEGQQQLCWVEGVKTQAAENRTEVTLQRSHKDVAPNGLIGAVQDFLKDSIEEASKSFEGKTATEVVAVLKKFQDDVTKSSGKNTTVFEILQNDRPSLDKVLQLAVKRRSTRLAAWIGEVQEELDSLAAALSSAADEASPSVSQTATPISALQALGAILKPLAAPPSEHPANEAGLARSNQETFGQRADTVPQLMTALRPELAPVLYKAWESLAPPLLQPGVYAFRVKAAPFGNSAPPKPIFDETGKIDGYEEWPIAGTEVIGVKLTFGDAVVSSQVELSAVISVKSGTDTYRAGLLLFRSKKNTDPGITIPGLKRKVVIGGAPALPGGLDIGLRGGTSPDVIFTVEEMNGSDSVKISLNDAERTSLVIGLGESLRFPLKERKLAISLLRQRETKILTIELQFLLPPDPRNILALDAPYEQIVPDSWVVIQRPNPKDPKELPLVIFDRAKRVETVSKSDYNLTPKVTQLALLNDWLFEPDRLLTVMRQTTVFAQSEKLTLAEEPINDDIQGDRLELDGLYAGLQPGRWIIVCGERTDIGDVTGVRACELQMLAAVEQGSTGDAPHSTLVLANKLAYSYAAESVKIYGNVVKATQGETRKETLGSGDGSKGTQQFTLRQPPLTFVAAPTPSGVDSTLKVYVNDVEWHETDSLSGLDPTDRKFITRANDEGQTKVIFGNGQQGARLPTGQENIRAAYRNGIGKGGNVKPEQISQLGTRPHGVSGVTNPLRASGGADKESRDQARKNAPLAVMALDRLVSTQDYADFARTFAGIGKASAARLSDGRRQIVHLTIAGADDIPIDKSSDLYRNLVKALRDFGDPYLPIQVDVRELLPLVIGAKVRVSPDYLWEAVKPQIVATLLDEFSFQRRELGQTVYLSEVISAIQRIAGVASVDVDLLHSISEAELLSSDPKDLGTKLETLAAASQPDPYVPVRLAETVSQAKESRPGATDSNGIFPGQLAFLTPEVTATIILNEAPL